MLILLQWIAMHLLADFVLQTKKLVQQKKERKARSWFLYIHCFIHASLIYILSPDKSLWALPVIIFITHYIIDLWKVYQKDNAITFIVDQLLHLLVLVIVWMTSYQSTNWIYVFFTRLLISYKFWVIAVAYLFSIFPLAYILGYATHRWRNEIEKDNNRSATSLSEAGRWIGIFERILVVTFVINNHFEGIGFLIAAKSILRYNDLKGENMRKETEYILIGTLMSFAASIMVGLFVNMLLK